MAGEVSSGYPSDVIVEEWAFVWPYLWLCREDSPQRRYLPHEYGPWWAVYQQMRRSTPRSMLRGDPGAGWMPLSPRRCSRRAVHRAGVGRRKGQPTAVCLDSRTLQSTPESGARAGYDGAKRRKGSKLPIASAASSC